ncbi:hypothetical protein [Lysobacter gummosus]|uniref:hypothetical protein n=1 Tax=Lysobacter gummosus TaxID=262324 RepID=UPI0036278C38
MTRFLCSYFWSCRRPTAGGQKRNCRDFSELRQLCGSRAAAGAGLGCGRTGWRRCPPGIIRLKSNSYLNTRSARGIQRRR